VVVEEEELLVLIKSQSTSHQLAPILDTHQADWIMPSQPRAATALEREEVEQPLFCGIEDLLAILVERSNA
jgi:hypothetical protein